ncbi:HRDC domain-containing protein [Maridesulfovibrio bastinii]|uniref:HRDC domain-containing protein n=1 Tax=Maridesulfovibrio bastinii TaxID=47157 RepID=UPI0004262AB2|nr:HRDC domain-containing protein [Maridesulfovibrio bastinii]
METRVITIPFDRDKGVFQDEQYRKFIMNKEIRSSRPEFFQVGTKAYWTVFLEYELVLEAEPSRAGSPTLSEPEKFFFDKLRVWRKEKAEREGIPTYVIATNSELMEVIKKTFTKRLFCSYGMTRLRRWFWTKRVSFASNSKTVFILYISGPGSPLTTACHSRSRAWTAGLLDPASFFRPGRAHSALTLAIL